MARIFSHSYKAIFFFTQKKNKQDFFPLCKKNKQKKHHKPREKNLAAQGKKIFCHYAKETSPWHYKLCEYLIQGRRMTSSPSKMNHVKTRKEIKTEFCIFMLLEG